MLLSLILTFDLILRGVNGGGQEQGIQTVDRYSAMPPGQQPPPSPGHQQQIVHPQTHTVVVSSSMNNGGYGNNGGTHTGSVSSNNANTGGTGRIEWAGPTIYATGGGPMDLSHFSMVQPSKTVVASSSYGQQQPKSHPSATQTQPAAGYSNSNTVVMVMSRQHPAPRSSSTRYGGTHQNNNMGRGTMQVRTGYQVKTSSGSQQQPTMMGVGSYRMSNFNMPAPGPQPSFHQRMPSYRSTSNSFNHQNRPQPAPSTSNNRHQQVTMTGNSRYQQQPARRRTNFKLQKTAPNASGQQNYFMVIPAGAEVPNGFGHLQFEPGKLTVLPRNGTIKPPGNVDGGLLSNLLPVNEMKGSGGNNQPRITVRRDSPLPTEDKTAVIKVSEKDIVGFDENGKPIIEVKKQPGIGSQIPFVNTKSVMDQLMSQLQAQMKRSVLSPAADGPNVLLTNNQENSKNVPNSVKNSALGQLITAFQQGKPKTSIRTVSNGIKPVIAVAESNSSTNSGGPTHLIQSVSSNSNSVNSKSNTGGASSLVSIQSDPQQKPPPTNVIMTTRENIFPHRPTSTVAHHIPANNVREILPFANTIPSPPGTSSELESADSSDDAAVVQNTSEDFPSPVSFVPLASLITASNNNIMGGIRQVVPNPNNDRRGTPPTYIVPKQFPDVHVISNLQVGNPTLSGGSAATNPAGQTPGIIIAAPSGESDGSFEEVTPFQSGINGAESTSVVDIENLAPEIPTIEPSTVVVDQNNPNNLQPQSQLPAETSNQNNLKENFGDIEEEKEIFPSHQSSPDDRDESDDIGSVSTTSQSSATSRPAGSTTTTTATESSADPAVNFPSFTVPPGDKKIDFGIGDTSLLPVDDADNENDNFLNVRVVGLPRRRSRIRRKQPNNTQKIN